MIKKRLDSLLKAVAGASNILILPHNNPDPDAIASAVALRYLLTEKLGLESQILYRGLVGRAENRALLKYLGYPLQHLVGSDLSFENPIALVDTQPGAGNNPFPPELKASIVIDHHPRCAATSEATFVDVRPAVGSASTIMTEYLRAAALTPPASLATALFYGLKTDTMGLGRGTGKADTSACCYLLPLIDPEALFEIERAQVPADYFKSFVVTLQGTRLYDGLAISYAGPLDYPDMVAEMADFLLRMEGGQWILCMGVYQDQLILSVRTHHQRGAGEMVQTIVGNRGVAGGHGAMAGGQVPLNGENPEQLAHTFNQRALEYLEILPEAEGVPLM